MAVELHPHQLKAIGEMHNGCILTGDVGSGKSHTAIGYFLTREVQAELPINGVGEYKHPKRPRDLYIITTAKKRDSIEWLEVAAAFNLSTERGSSLGEIQVKVDSWNSIPNYETVKDAFFIFDEQRLVGAGAWVQAFLKIAKHNRWIVLSATPGDNWMDFAPVFIANGFYKNRTEFIKRHVVYSRFSKFPKVDRYVEQGHLEGLRRRVLVDMPFARHTKRHVLNVLVSHNESLFERAWKDRWNVYDERPLKDVGELFRIARKIVNSDISRLGAVMELMEKHPRLIIFYNFNYELESLRTLGTTLGIPIGEWNGHKHQGIPEGDRWLYLVQYTAGAEGWNCVTTDAMIFYSLNYSYKINEQAKGRIDRMNTPYIDLYYYILRSASKIDQYIMLAIAGKKNFNERVIKW